MSNHDDTSLPTQPELQELDVPVNHVHAATLPLFAARPESKPIKVRAGIRAGTFARERKRKAQ